jgi:type II secretory pathway component PulF
MYKGVDPYHKGCQGTFLAPNQEVLLAHLQERKVKITHVSVCKEKKYAFLHSVNPEEILTFFMHIEGQTLCGFTLLHALRSFLDISRSLPLRAALARIIERLEDGESFGDAFSFETSLFGPISVALLHASEATGHVRDVLPALIEHLQLSHQASHKLRRAIQQPLFTLVFSIGAAFLCARLLGPQIKSLDGLSQETLPWFSLCLLNFFDCINFTLFSLGLGSTIFIGFGMWLHPSTRSTLHYLSIKIPFIKQIVQRISTWQFSVALALLLKAKVGLLQALPFAARAVGNLFVRQTMLACEEDIRSGKAFSQAIDAKGNSGISQNFVNALKIGEKTNTLLHVLEVFNNNWYRDLQFFIQRASMRLSVFITCAAGILLIGLLLGLFYPIYHFIGQVDF